MIEVLARFPTFQVFLAAVLAMVATAAFTPLWIKFLKLRGVGQIIRADGPQEHLPKQGTPTMGGLLVLFVITLSVLVLGKPAEWSTMALITALGCGLVGFWDDFSKTSKERSLGLRARTKIILELLMAFILGFVAVNYFKLSPDVAVPFFDLKLPFGKAVFSFSLGPRHFEVPWLYLIFLFAILTATVNSVNLTDGLDGLAAGTVAIVMLAYAGIAFKQDLLDLAIFSSAVGGACVGFLWYNSHPADIFMGDTGSLGLGGAIAALAILTKTELLLLLIGGIYVIETLSVIIQVTSFKWFKKRVFKMAPIHHHFEIKGWSETKIMIRFWIVAGMLAGAGFILYFTPLLKG